MIRPFVLVVHSVVVLVEDFRGRETQGTGSGTCCGGLDADFGGLLAVRDLAAERRSVYVGVWVVRMRMIVLVAAEYAARMGLLR